MKHLVFISLALCMTACGGSTSEGGGSTGDPNSTSTTGLCGTNATTIGYSAQAAAVLNASCVSCHAAGGTESSSPLDTYANAKANLTSSNVQTYVDSGSMPPSGSLTANQKCILDNWASGGYAQ